MARGQENVLGDGSEFVVFEFSVVRHDSINLPRFASMGVVSSARMSARRSAQEGAKESPYLGRKGLDKRKTFLDAKEGYRPRPARRAISLYTLPYPRAQCACNMYMTCCSSGLNSHQASGHAQCAFVTTH